MTLSNAQRSTLVQNANWLISNGSKIGYGTARPFDLRTKAQLELIFARDEAFDPDCSMGVAEVYLLSGCKDPTGFDFAGFGNTETMMAHLPTYTNPIDAHPGAVVIFGVGLPLAEQHACMVLKQGKNPTLFSHGSAFRTISLSLSEEQSAHSGGTLFCDVSSLG